MRGVATRQDIEALEAEGIPELPASTYELLRRGAAIDPGAAALSFFASVDEHRHPETWTYRELVARVTQTANFLHRLGATRDTVIGVVLPNLPESHLAIWGGEAAGVIMPLNPMLEGEALAALLEAAAAEILVTLAPSPLTDLWSKLQPTFARLPALRHVVLVNAADRAGVPAHELAATARSMPERVRVHDLAGSIRIEVEDALVSHRRFSASDPSSWFCTGGTTGLPKLAMRTHGNEVANAASLAQVLGDTVGPGKVMLCGLPLFHVNAVIVTGLLPFSRGAQVVLATPHGYRSPGLVSRFWEIVEHHRVSFFSGVPTLYSSLLQVPVGGRDLTSLEYGLCGAAPMASEVQRLFEERTGLRILEGYGLTEATCVSSVNPPRGERRVGSIGLRVPGQQMRAVMLDDQGAFLRDCAVDEVGVVAVSGPNVFAGYRDPAQDRGLWIDRGDGNRWLNTGDLGRQDGDGYFWLTGRKKDLIIRGGHNIDPAVIEETLHRHPAVELAAAVGRPDAHAGELPIAYVQLRRDAAATEAELLEYARGKIAERAAVPKHVRIVPRMPLTAVGKIYKPALRRSETKDALETALREAGVPIRALDIVDDPARGLTVELRVEDDAARAEARRVLGRFPLRAMVTCDPASQAKDGHERQEGANETQ